MNNETGYILTDKQLVDKVLRGDSRAFGVIIKNTERLVAQIVFKMIDNAEDRKDIAQDVYLKTFQNLPTFRFQSKLSTWIAQIAYHRCLSYLEKKKLVLTGDLQEETDADNEITGTQNAAAAAKGNEPEKSLFLKERSSIIQAAIEQLPPIYKTLITLYHQEDLSYDEISQVTALPVGTVKSYLSRARKTLKDGLLRNYKREEL